ncbi:MAG: 6-bladed beta-propeller [Pseudomonadota bacterium]
MKTISSAIYNPVLIFCIAFLLIARTVVGEDIIKNSSKPLSQNAGRIFTLEKVLSISDDGDLIFFRYPSKLAVAPDGSIFEYDWSAGQLLRFDGNGKMIRNYMKKGQGPGELEYVSDYLFYRDNIIVYDGGLQKILWLNLNGDVVKEFKLLRKARMTNFHLYKPDQYYFIQYTTINTQKNPSFVEIPHDLVSFSGPGEDLEYKELERLYLKSYVIPSKAGGGGWFSIDRMITTSAANRYLFLSCSQEYLIRVFDAETGHVIRSFNRQYKRVKPDAEYIERTKKGGITINGKHYSEPKRKYVNDIQNVFVHRNKLWVMTSTEDKDKGILFDVFGFDGQYENNFYIKFTDSNRPMYGGIGRMAFFDGYFYQIETTADDSYVINKYRLIESVR